MSNYQNIMDLNGDDVHLPEGYDLKLSPEFIGVRAAGYTDEQHYAGDGWKFHLSVDPEDVPRAFDLLLPIIERHGVQTFKVTTEQYSERFNEPEHPQRGKQFTIYGARNDPNFRWDEVIRDIEIEFRSEGIKPSHSIQGDRMVAGSLYAGYRNELSHGVLDGYARDDGYLGARNIREAVRKGDIVSGWEHNPTQQLDTLANIDFSNDQEVLHASQANRELLHTNHQIVENNPAHIMPTYETNYSEQPSVEIASNHLESRNIPISSTQPHHSESLDALLARKNEAGEIVHMPTYRGYTVVLRGTASELQQLQNEFDARGIQAVREVQGSDFGEGIRVRSTGVEQFEELLSHAAHNPRNISGSNQWQPIIQQQQQTYAASISADNISIRETQIAAQERIQSLTRSGVTVEEAIDIARQDLNADGGRSAKSLGSPEPQRPIVQGAVQNNLLASETLRAEQAAVNAAGRIGAVDAGQASLHAYMELGHAGRVGTLLRRGGQKIPLAGAALAGGFAAYALYNAENGFNDGKMGETQIAAVRAALVPYVMSQSGSFVTGIAGEEAVDASLVAAGVPAEFRLGTLRESISTGAQSLLDAHEFNRRRQEIPSPAVQAFVQAMNGHGGNTQDAALNDFFAARDLAILEGREGRVQSSTSFARFGALPRSHVSPQEVNERITDAARTYLAFGGTVDSATAAMSDDPARVRVNQQINDILFLVPDTTTIGEKNHPTGNAHLDRLRTLSMEFSSSDANSDRKDVLRQQMHTEAANYLAQGHDARDAVKAYFNGPFVIARETIAQIPPNPDLLRVFDGADGSAKDGIASVRELGLKLANMGVYNRNSDTNRDGELDFTELQAVARNPEAFRSRDR